MNTFSPLEKTALNAILGEAERDRRAIEGQLLRANVAKRENTGGGFFVDIVVDPGAGVLDLRTPPLGKNVWIGVAGLQYGLGAILHFKDGRISLLEGYAVGPENTSAIEFATVAFAIIAEPGPLPTYGGG